MFIIQTILINCLIGLSFTDELEYDTGCTPSNACVSTTLRWYKSYSAQFECKGDNIYYQKYTGTDCISGNEDDLTLIEDADTRSPPLSCSGCDYYAIIRSYGHTSSGDAGQDPGCPNRIDYSELLYDVGCKTYGGGSRRNYCNDTGLYQAYWHSSDTCQETADQMELIFEMDVCTRGTDGVGYLMFMEMIYCNNGNYQVSTSVSSTFQTNIAVLVVIAIVFEVFRI